MSNKYSTDDLSDFVMIESSIECSNCHSGTSVMGEDAEYYFFEQGWRATKSGNVYCPECAKKKLKL